MPKPAAPELKKYMEQKIFVNLQGNRKVSGTLRGYDIFLNLVLDNATDETKLGEKVPVGTMILRGSSVSNIETVGWQR